MNLQETNITVKNMDDSTMTTVSFKNILEDLKNFKIKRNFEVLQKYFAELMQQDDDSMKSQYSVDDLNECVCLTTDCLYQLSLNCDEQIIFRKLLFYFSVKKLEILRKETPEVYELRLSILNNGGKLVKLCIDKKYFANIDYYLSRIMQEIDILENVCTSKNIGKDQIVYKRIEIVLYNVEKMISHSQLLEAMEELNRQKETVLKLKTFQEYYIGLCYNTSLICNQNCNYDYALTALLLAFDVCKAAEEISRNMKTALNFLVCVCLKYNPTKNWHYGINALELACKSEIDMFYLMGKIKFAVITQNQSSLEQILNQAADWLHLSTQDIIQIAQVLRKNDLNILAAEFVQTVRFKSFSIDDKFLLMKLEIQIYISASDRKLYSLLENAIDLIKIESIDKNLIFDLFKLILSYAETKFKEKLLEEALIWYTYCVQISEVSGLDESLLNQVQMKICLCYIDMSDWKSAKHCFEKLKASSNAFDSYYVYLALQIAFMTDDEKLAENALKTCDGADNKSGDILLTCCYKAMMSGKKQVLFKILETILLKYDSIHDDTILGAKISQCLCGLSTDFSGENENYPEKFLLFMDKALQTLQQNSDHEETSELSQWFSRAAWNLALTPGIAPKYTFEFFLRCCCFSEISVRNLHRLKNSLMLAAASGLHVVRKIDPKEKEERVTILGKIMTVIEKCKSLEPGTNITLLRLLYLYEFEARCHLNQWDEACAKEVLKLPFMDVKTLEHIAAIVNEFAPKNYQIIIESLKAAVRKILEDPEVDSSQISKTYHSLVEILFYVQEYLSPTAEEDNLNLCRDILNFIENKTSGNYPQVEILWLTTRCWNWGIQKLTQSDGKRAYKWCSLSMAFLQKLDSLKTLHEKKLTELFSTYFYDNQNEEDK